MSFAFDDDPFIMSVLDSGIVGGTETAGAENLDLSLAALKGQTLTHSGPYAAGTFGHYAATTNSLTTGTYSQAIFMNEKTDVVVTPEPETLAPILPGLCAMVFMARRRQV